MSVLILCAALFGFAQTDNPIQVTQFRIYGERAPYCILSLENKAELPVVAVEFQFDTYDSERRVFRSRYFLQVGKVPGGLGKPIAPGKARGLQGPVSSRLGFLYGYWTSDGGDVRINVIHFSDGSKWERKGWKDEPNPNQ